MRQRASRTAAGRRLVCSTARQERFTRTSSGVLRISSNKPSLFLAEEGHRQVVLTRRAMDSMEIDCMVVFPTPLLALGMHPEPDVEVALGKAFNRWLVEEILPQELRIKGMMYLPFDDPASCVEVVEEFSGKPGVIGFTVTSTRYKPVHHNDYMRLYAALQDRNMPLAFHSGFHWGDESMRQTNRFLSMHALSFCYFNMIHLTNWIVNGIPERFPKLKVIWVESGLAWLSFLMQRLNSEYMMRTSEAPLLKKKPSEYMREMFYTSQPLETSNLELTEATFKAMNAENQLLFASDWPHWDSDLRLDHVPAFSQRTCQTQYSRHQRGEGLQYRGTEGQTFAGAASAENGARLMPAAPRRRKKSTRSGGAKARLPATSTVQRSKARKSKSHKSMAERPKAPHREPAASGQAFCAMVSAALNRGEPNSISDATLRQVFGAAVRAYAAKAEATGTEPDPFEGDSVTATEAVVAACAIIRAVDLNLFDVAMWFRRPVGGTSQETQDERRHERN